MTVCILIIEDEASFARNVRDYLAFDGFDAHVCDDGQSGITRFVELQPDLVLLDYGLPDKNGLVVLGELRSLEPCAKVIMLTAHGHRHLMRDARDAGVASFLTKPIALSEIRREIQRVL
ncbi:MAG: response regulator [Geminicoccaceae bacterium]